MRFDQLNQSIELNAEESPSLYNTLNMIRSLFRDVEDAADAPLSQCPIGDSKLPLEMIWLGKELLSIYQDNSDALQRNRARLDSIMEKLAAGQTELESLAQVEKLLPGKQAEYRALEEKLTAARAEKALYEKLLEDIQSAQSELALLQRFDMDAARQKLQTLQEQVRDLEDQIRSLDQQIQTLTGAKDQAEGTVADLRGSLLALQEQLARLDREKTDLLLRKEQAEQEVRDLKAAITAVRSRLEELCRWIPAARNTLQELEDRARTLSAEKESLTEQIRLLRASIEELSLDIGRLRNEYDQVLLPEKQRLVEEKLRCMEKKARLEREIAALVGETRELDAELVALQGTLSQRLRERDEAREAVAQYRLNVLGPIVTERDSLLSTQQQLQAEKSAAEQQITELSNNQRTLILEIGRKKDQFERDTTEYEKHVRREQELAREQEQLTVQLNTAVDALQLRQTEYDKLKNEDLPAAEKFLADETLRRDQLRQKVEGIQTQCRERTDDINQMNDELPALQNKLRNLQQNYDALTVTYNASNSDIVELERRIRELERKNDQERLAQYRSQLTEKKLRLEALSETCATLEGEIRELGQQVETETENRLSLENRKKIQEDGLKGIRLLLEELKPWAAPEKRVAAENTKRQFDTLKIIRDNLGRSIRDASRQIVGFEIAADDLNIIELEDYLTNAAECSRDLCASLSRCAQTIEKYIMEEPK